MQPAALTSHKPLRWVPPQQVMQSLRQIVTHPAILRIRPVARVVSLVAQSRNKDHVMLRVPTEIWEIIVSYLPPISAACLALSSTTLYYHLGRRHWLDLKRKERVAVMALEEPKTLYALLNYYETSYPFPKNPTCRWNCRKDSPCHALSHQDCKDIFRVHLWPSLQSFGKVNLLFPLTRCDNFGFWQVQLIMNLYRNTSDGSLSLKAIDHAWTAGSWNIHTYAFINRGKLIIKTKMQQKVDPRVDPDLVNDLRCGKELAYLRDILCVRGELCKTSHSGTVDLEHMLRSVLKDYWNEDCPAKRSSCEMCQFCPSCYTAYLIKIQILPSGPEMQSPTATNWNCTPFSINVTRLSDYGEGKTPGSLQWRTATDTWLPMRRKALPPFEPWPVSCYTESDVLQAFAEREPREAAHYPPLPRSTITFLFTDSNRVQIAESQPLNE